MTLSGQKKNNCKDLIDCLERSPSILRDLIREIPEGIMKVRRRPGKWSIHEHICHIADVQPMLTNRLEAFRQQTMPEFNPYLLGINEDAGHLINMDDVEALEAFEKSRVKLTRLAREFPDDIWGKVGIHPEYSTYTPKILLRHILMHDHLHLYRIEELWLTRKQYLQ